MDIPKVARLAAQVPGQPGVAMFRAARSHGRHEIAGKLRVPVDQVDALLANADGDQLVRGDWSGALSHLAWSAGVTI